MEDDSAVVVHLVELINAADTTITEDNGTRLENELLGLRVLGDVGGETDGGRALSGGVDSSGRDLVDVAEDLGLGGGGVTDQETVDLSPESAAGGL